MPTTVSIDGIVGAIMGFFGSVGGGIVAFAVVLSIFLWRYSLKPKLPAMRAALQSTSISDTVAQLVDTVVGGSSVHSSPVQPAVSSTPNAAELDTRTVPDAGRAMLNPPTGVEAAIAYMTAAYQTQYKNTARYLVPLGWYVDLKNVVQLAWGYLVGPSNFNFFLVTGQPDSGKDNFILWIVLCLLFQHPPEEIELWIIDPKGLDWGVFKNKAHVKMLHVGTDNIELATEAITAERRRRMRLIQQLQAETGARKWETLPDDKRPPMMLLIVTELTALRVALKEAPFDKWMSDELSQLRAFGGRGLIGTQNVNNLGTNWRGMISLFAGGYQARRIYDEPNMNLTAPEIIELGQRNGLGAVPPSQLQKSVDIGDTTVSAQGVMTLVEPPDMALTIRTSYISDEAFLGYLAKLPDRPKNATPADDDEEPAPPAEKSAQRTSEMFADISDEPDAPKFMGPHMGYDEIADYVEQRRKDAAPSFVSQAKIETELFGYQGGTAARKVSAALEARSRRPLLPGTTTSSESTTTSEPETATTEEKALLLPISDTTTTENDQESPETGTFSSVVVVE